MMEFYWLLSQARDQSKFNSLRQLGLLLASECEIQALIRKDVIPEDKMDCSICWLSLTVVRTICIFRDVADFIRLLFLSSECVGWKSGFQSNADHQVTSQATAHFVEYADPVLLHTIECTQLSFYLLTRGSLFLITVYILAGDEAASMYGRLN